jgi:hypothetical protein
MTHASRRQSGLIIGLVLGAGFSVTSNMINNWALPEIPFFEPWPGRIGLIALSTGLFGLLGAIAGWTEESLPGVILSALVGSLISSVWIAINETADRTGTFVILFIVFLPRMFFYAPFGALVRWLIGRLEYHPYRTVAPAVRLIPVIVSFVAISLFGITSLLSDETRLSIARLEALIKEGQKATARTELPLALQDVNGFVQNAKGEYTYEVGRNPDALPVQRPLVEYGEEEPFLIIRFENGFRFGCVFSPPYVVPACIDF